MTRPAFAGTLYAAAFVGSFSCANVGVFASTPSDVAETFTAVALELDCAAPLDRSLFRTNWRTNAVEYRYLAHSLETVSDDAVSVGTGVCAITATAVPLENRAFTSGTLNTSGMFEVTGGYFEIGWRPPDGHGLTSYFQLQSEEGQVPVLYVAQRAEMLRVGAAYLDATGATRILEQEIPLDPALGSYRVGIEWSEDAVRYYVDARLAFEITDRSAIPTIPLFPSVALEVGQVASPSFVPGPGDLPATLMIEELVVRTRP